VARRILLAAFALGLAVSISLAEVALAGLALSLLLPLRRGDRPPLTWPLATPIGAFALWTVVSALASARPLESLTAAKSLLVLATFFVVLGSLPDGRAAHRLATTIFVLVAVVAALSIAQVAACPETPPAQALLHRFFRKCVRARGFYSIYMTLAGVLTLVLVATLPRIMHLGAGLLWRLSGWLVALVALGLTYVRGAWLAFLAGALGCALGGRRRAIALGGLVAVTAAMLVLAPGVLPRARTIGDPLNDTARDRLVMLDAGLRMAWDHPVVGVGVGQVKHLYPLYAPPDAPRRRSHLHNTPLQITVERGLPGFLLWSWIFAAFFLQAARILGRLPREAGEDRALVLGSIMAIAAFLVGGLTEYNFGDTEVLLVACSLMALPFVIERDLARPAQ